MQKICKLYAKNMQLHRLQHSKYANYMQKICKKYAQYATKICNKYAINMQNMHKSMYLHILHIYALPTLLMMPSGLRLGARPDAIALSRAINNKPFQGSDRRNSPSLSCAAQTSRPRAGSCTVVVVRLGQARAGISVGPSSESVTESN